APPCDLDGPQEPRPCRPRLGLPARPGRSRSGSEGRMPPTGPSGPWPDCPGTAGWTPGPTNDPNRFASPTAGPALAAVRRAGLRAWPVFSHVADPCPRPSCELQWSDSGEGDFGPGPVDGCASAGAPVQPLSPKRYGDRPMTSERTGPLALVGGAEWT